MIYRQVVFIYQVCVDPVIIYIYYDAFIEQVCQDMIDCLLKGSSRVGQAKRNYDELIKTILVPKSRFTFIPFIHRDQIAPILKVHFPKDSGASDALL
jgi:hypothetical protein